VNVFRSEGWSGLRRGLSRFAAVSGRQAAAGNDYSAWVARYDTLTDTFHETLSARASALLSRPLISVIMPVYNPRPQWLEEAIESVRGQIYENWELCIADDASTLVGVREILRKYEARDSRIKVIFRERNGHISAASNTALAQAQGEWIALMDHDDLLTPHALFYVADAVNRIPDAQVVYSDEDKIDAVGVRTAPHFKPDWNPELFLSYNYLCHLSAYKHMLVRDVGGFREGYEGAQDYDLALRCTERLTEAQIVHVPRILYHWRLHRDSTAIGKSSKPYALPAGARALNDHLMRVGLHATAEERSGGAYRVKMQGAPVRPTVSVVLVNDDSIHHGSSVLDDLQAVTAYPFTETLQASGDLCHTIQNACGDYVLIVDPAVRPRASDWLDTLMGGLRQRGVGVVGPRIVDSGGRQLGSALVLGLTGLAGVAHAGLASGDSGYFQRATITQAVTALSPYCVLMERSLWMRVVDRLQMDGWKSMASVELCLQLHELGWRTVYVADAVVEMPRADVDLSVHLTPDGQGRPIFEAALRHGDHAYNPNLDLTSAGGFSLAWPPRLAMISDQSLDRPVQQHLNECQ